MRACLPALIAIATVLPLSVSTVLAQSTVTIDPKVVERARVASQVTEAAKNLKLWKYQKLHAVCPKCPRPGPLRNDALQAFPKRQR